MLEPTASMMKDTRGWDELRFQNMRNIAVITFNFPLKARDSMTADDCVNIADVIKSRGWCKLLSKWRLGFENLTKGGEVTHPHLAVCVELITNYAPSQIAQMLYRNKHVKKLVKKVNFVDVKKHRRVEKEAMVAYCEKHCYEVVTV